MNLRELRIKFVQLSGLYHLMNDDGSDNGANFLISSGLKYLENLAQFGKSEALIVKDLPKSGVVNLPRFRTVSKVFIRRKREENEPKENWLQLKKLLHEDFKTHYTSKPSWHCRPFGWIEVTQRGNAGAGYVDENTDVFTDVQDSRESTNQAVRQLGVRLVPRAGIEMEVLIQGLVREKFTEDSDVCFWSEEWPNVLIWAAQRENEILNRNTSGVRDWDNAISSALVQIDQEQVWDEAEHIDVIVG